VPLRRVELLLIFAFWTFMAVLTAANGLLDPRGRGLQPLIPSAPVALAFAESYLWALLTPLIFWLGSRLNVERSSWVRRVLLLTAVGVLVAMFVEAVVSYLRLHVFFAPPPGLLGHPRRFDPLFGVTRLFWLDDLVVYIAIVAAGFARDYFHRYRARLEEAARLQAQAAGLQAHAAHLQAQLAEARLAVLRTQLNPHFLFNTLHAMSSLVERDPKGVRRMIARLSELLRCTLEGPTEQEITVREELDLLRRYVEIMQIRFQGRLESHFNVSPEAEEALVPTWILQPLVENAMKHGVSRVRGVGRIEVDVRRSGDELVLAVSDNGPGADASRANGALPEGAASGVGLRNTRARLEEMYGAQQRFTLRPSPDGGTVAEIVLPYHTRADLRAAGAPAPL
jgi:two-component sensor histidine kinase